MKLFPRIRYEKTANGAYEILRRKFRGDKKLRVVKLQAIRAEFEYLRISDGETLNDYLARFFEIVNNLKSLVKICLKKKKKKKGLCQKLLMSLSRRYKFIMSITEKTRDLYNIKNEEVLASVKVYNKIKELHDIMDKFSGTERAFRSLKVGSNNNNSKNYKSAHNRQNQKWGQNKKGRNWSHNSNWNNSGNTSWNNKNSFQGKQGSNSQGTVKPQNM